jgi:glycosyltransferase involved in cell wall biosynthesis
MKRGLPSFIHREIGELFALGMEVVLYPTKRGRGPYMPEPHWPVRAATPGRVLWHHLLTFLTSPWKYVSLLVEAARSRSLVHFAAAMTFVPDMKRDRIDVIYCQEALHSMFIGYYCKRLLALPLSVLIHADGLYMGESWPVFRPALAACDDVLTVCNFNREMLIEKYGLDPERVKVLRLFADHETFCPDERVSILIVGQFSQRKGHDLLLKAVKSLDRSDLVIWVVGEGTWGVSDFADVRALAAELGMNEQVIFFGSVSENTLRTLYRNCDIFCLPSRKFVVNEGLPVSLMEAMASEKPVISTRHAGIPELVPDLLVDEEDVEGLARAIAHLADHPEERLQTGKRNRAVVKERYSRENVKQLRDVFLVEIESAHR